MDPDTEDALVSSLRRLARADVDARTARTVRVAAERRLEGRRAPSSLARFEPPVLVGLALVHLVWAALRVLTLAH